MRIFERGKTKSPSLADVDPFEALDIGVFDRTIPNHFLVEEEKTTTIKAPKVLSKGRRFLPLAFLGLLVAITGFGIAKSEFWTMFSTEDFVFAYFEVRAVDNNGRPIAGAVVKNAGKRVGTTDSFGEWRRYMKVPLGATVRVTLAKNLPGRDLLFATKNFAVPPSRPNKSEIELRGSIQLLAVDKASYQALQAAQGQRSDNDKTQNSNVLQKEPSTHSTQEASGMVRESSAEDVAIKSAPAASNGRDITTVNESNKPESSTQEHFVSSHSTIWFEAVDPSSTLMSGLVAALHRRATTLGLKASADAGWRIKVTELRTNFMKSDRNSDGLVLLSFTDGAGTHEFIRNQTSDLESLAQGILFILKHHVAKNVKAEKVGDRWVATLPTNVAALWKLQSGMNLKGAQGAVTLGAEEITSGDMKGYKLEQGSVSPCRDGAQACEIYTRTYEDIPPMPSWKKLKLKVSFPIKETVKLFVSGYEAKSIGDRLFEYWGPDHTKSNITLVQNHKLLARGQVLNDVKQIPVFQLPVVSKR